MKKKILSSIIVLILGIMPLSIQGAGDKSKRAASSPATDESALTATQALYSDLIEIKKVYFNKTGDRLGRGEVLEVEFKVKNQIDDPQDLYIFVIATYEKKEKPHSSFNPPVSEKERLKSFVPYPDDIRNFEYTGKNGETRLLKRPKNPKAGINPETGKPYHLTNHVFIRATHLSEYRNNYYFFNRVLILAYNIDGKLIFRQQYKIEGVRN